MEEAQSAHTRCNKNMRPTITISYAQSADGRIATKSGQSRWISGEETLTFAHTLRGKNDSILVGIGTVLRDDPSLTCRLKDTSTTGKSSGKSSEKSSPQRVVLDSHLRVPLDAKIIRTASEIKTRIFTLAGAPSEKRKALEKRGALLHFVEKDEEGLSIPAVLAQLYKEGSRNLFVEGGANIITSFFRHRLVDTLFLVCAPMIIGEGISALGELNTELLEDAFRGSTIGVSQKGKDIVWEIRFPQPKGLEKAVKTRALYFTAPGEVKVREEELPSLKESSLMKVESKIIGISHGTERRIYRGEFNRDASRDGLTALEGRMDYPLKYGYMNAGINEEGNRVFAFFPHQEMFFIDPEDCIPFPKDMDFEDILLYPSVETAFTVVLDTAPLPGERVLVIGQGMIGLLITEVLTHTGNAKVVTVEKNNYRAGLSRQLTDICLHPDDRRLETTIKEVFNGEYPEKIIHVSGTEEGLSLAISLGGFETTIIEASWYGNRKVSVPLGNDFHRKRLILRSSQVSTLPGYLRPRWDPARRTKEVKELIKLIRPSKYITHRYSFSRAAEAFRDINEEKEDLLQAVLIP